MQFDKKEISETLALSWPIILSQLGIMLMGVADTIQVGGIVGSGATAVAAAGFANGIWITLAITGFNTIAVVSPMISKANEEDNHQKIKDLLKSVIRLSLWLGLVVVVLGCVCAWGFGIFGQVEVVTALSRPYLVIIAISTIPVFLFTGLKQLTDGLSQTRYAMYITLSAVGVNVLLNHIFIHGLGFIPAMGLNGAGIATLLSRCYMLIAMYMVISRLSVFKDYLLNGIVSLQKHIFSVGFPAGLQGFFEIGVFATAAMMMGWIGKAALAAHIIAINPASITYMMINGVGIAGGIRVGAGLGQQSKAAVRASGTTALMLSLVFMGISCLIFLLFARQIVGLYTSDISVVAVAVPLVVVAGFFQLFDGIQAVSLGLLRGLADVKVPTGITLIAYWGVCLPIGYFCAFVLKMGSLGIWYGLTAGLAAAAIFLSWRFFNRTDALRF